MSGAIGPFYFAWVDSTETTFGVEHHVEDEHVFSVNIEHLEGQNPTLSIEIKNPGIGLLAPSRKTWAWLSWRPESGDVVPLFFGRLVGVPKDLTAEVVTISFVARSVNYLAQKQTLAETLKVRPYYDPVFIDDSHRDDPDALLEGYSAHWHIDRTSLDLSISDIISGEDGVEVFEEADSFYDSVQISLEQSPLRAVQVQASVKWLQRTRPTPLIIGKRSIPTYTGDSLISDWPKSGQNIAGGWGVLSASAIDVLQLRQTVMFTASSTWTNKEKEHDNGDTLSNSISVTYPVTQAFTKKYTVKVVSQVGIVDPFSDPPTNRPAKTDETFLYVPQWNVSTNLILHYQAARNRTEDLIFTLTADVQPILSDPNAPTVTDSELLKINGTDVGRPIINVLSWFSVAGKAVDFGQVILIPVTAVPLVLEPTYQICVGSGTAGTDEPTWNPIQGTTTTDGGVTWVNLGSTLNTSNQDWSRHEQIGLGEIILPLEPIPLTWASLVPTDAFYTGEGGGISLGQIIKTGSVYQQCTQPGTTDITPPAFATVRGSTTTDGGVVWTCLGNAIPDGMNYQLCTQAGVTGSILPGFMNAAGTTTTDGTVVWTALGPAEGGIAMPIGDPSRRSYFPTDRGLESIEYLLCRARARLLARSRAVQISFDCRFERAIELSCRKNALLYDRRLPGGQALGKIVAYSIIADGDSGEIIGRVTMACAVGLDGHVSDENGSPLYVESGYVDDGYQAFSGGIVALPASDVGYSVPIDEVNDDGLVFPLTKNSAIMVEELHGSLADQVAAIEAVIPKIIATYRLEEWLPALGPSEFARQSQAVHAMGLNTVARALAHKAIWYELQLNPVAGQSFSSEYALTTTTLSIPKMIDLEATS